ncbi:MAG: aminotransferase class IV [Steroidobacteraceae bacterium]
MGEPFPICHLNGELMALPEARISPLDRSFLFADGVYEVIPVYAGRPFRFHEHFDRLNRSCREIRLRDPHSRAAWAQITSELLVRNHLAAGVAGTAAPDAYVYVQISRGAEAGRTHAPLPDIAPTVFAFCSPWPQRAPEIRERGVACVTAQDNRWGRCDIKSVALLANVLLRDAAARAGASEVILLRDGELTEASAATVHVLVGDEVRTPPNTQRILPGTTRSVVEELATALGIAHRATAVTERELRAADEIWLAAATREIDAVTTLDDRPVGSGRPGPLWQRAFAEFQALKRRLAGHPW